MDVAIDILELGVSLHEADLGYKQGLNQHIKIA